MLQINFAGVFSKPCLLPFLVKFEHLHNLLLNSFQILLAKGKTKHILFCGFVKHGIILSSEVIH